MNKIINKKITLLCIILLSFSLTCCNQEESNKTEPQPSSPTSTNDGRDMNQDILSLPGSGPENDE